MFKKFTHLAAEEVAEQVNCGQVNPRGGLFVERRNRTAIESSLADDVGNAKLMTSHQGRQVAADYGLVGFVGVLRRTAKSAVAHNPGLVSFSLFVCWRANATF